ncbi:hypothetical protein PCANC_19677 [Puccinia coronata f. sp. avenae]|uniref:Uncharacterized protein n=1 Tax=Puccinia coronata f. sp. avenae TaxID=200324 RepID=A0A2N5SAT0_9BASI|nr:hypothetical protein PCANC_19677 [Puccinia coronata f. sp. avenae]
MTPQQAGAPAGVGGWGGRRRRGDDNGHQSMYGFPAGLQQPQMAFHPALPHQSSSALSPPFLNNNPAAPQSPSHAHSPASSTSSPLKNSQHQHHHPAAAANHYSYHP